MRLSVFKAGNGTLCFYIKFKSTKGEIKMIRLRNPWGGGGGQETEWNGAWCDNAPEWKTISQEEKAAAQLGFDDDGEFWCGFSYPFSSKLTQTSVESQYDFRFALTWRLPASSAPFVWVGCRSMTLSRTTRRSTFATWRPIRWETSHTGAQERAPRALSARCFWSRRPTGTSSCSTRVGARTPQLEDHMRSLIRLYFDIINVHWNRCLFYRGFSII